jgi:hypothetical protein
MAALFAASPGVGKKNHGAIPSQKQRPVDHRNSPYRDCISLMDFSLFCMLCNAGAGRESTRMLRVYFSCAWERRGRGKAVYSISSECNRAICGDLCFFDRLSLFRVGARRFHHYFCFAHMTMKYGPNEPPPGEEKASASSKF